MRLAVLVAFDGSSAGSFVGSPAEESWLRAALARLGFGIAPSFDDVPFGATLLVHVSGRVVEALGHLRALGERAAAREPESALFLAELTHETSDEDSLVAAEHVEQVREAVGARDRGHAALVAVRAKRVLDEPYAFSRLVVRAAEEAKDARSARLSEVVERLRAFPERHAVAQGYAHVRGVTDFELGRHEGPAFAPLLALADGARDRREWDQATAGYRAALLVAHEAKARASVYARLGAVERSRGDLREAKRAFEKAREHDPDDPVSLSALVSLSHDLGDWGRYVTLARTQVEQLDSPTEKADLHFALARSLVEHSRDLPAAVVELEKARQLEPHRDDVLEALRRAYRVLGEWKKLIEITGVLANDGLSDAERSARRFAQAKIALEKVGDQQLGIAFLDAALTEDPTNDEALDILVEVRTSRGEVAQLGRALEELVARYEEMGDTERARDARRCIEGLPSVAPAVVATTPAPSSTPSLELLKALPSAEELDSIALTEDDEPGLPFEVAPSSSEMTGPMVALPPTLEELPADSLLDYEDDGSFPSVDPLPEPVVEVTSQSREIEVPRDLQAPVASEVRPVADEVPIFVAGETGLHAALHAETIPTPSADDETALLELEEAVAKTPLDASLHALLFRLHLDADRIDRAYLSALALEELGTTGPEHLAVLDQCRPDGPLRLRALLDDPAWEALRGPGADDVVESLFSAVAPAAIAAQIEERRARRKLLSLDPERKQSSSSTVSIVASFHWAARVLGVTCPDLYVLDEVPGDIAAVPSGDPSTALGPRVLSGLGTRELAFLAARHLTYYRREYAPLVHFSSLSELTLLVLACVQLELPAVPIPHSVAAAVAAHRTRIARHLNDSDRTTMAAAVERLESRGGRLDLAAWVRSVELTAARAGLFLCGDLRAAMNRLRADDASADSAAFQAARGDLIGFAVSRAHADLRAEFALVSAPRSSGLRSRDELAMRPSERPTEARAV
jgi:tetratricopeptide (TPR) repeat protein